LKQRMEKINELEQFVSQEREAVRIKKGKGTMFFFLVVKKLGKKIGGS